MISASVVALSTLTNISLVAVLCQLTNFSKNSRAVFWLIPLNIPETINQSIRIFDAGSDYVRITAPSIKEAKALKEIKKMRQR